MTTPPHRRSFTELAVHDLAANITERSILVQPVGAVEAHGPHLPLATDHIVACAAVDQAVARFGDDYDLWALPPLAYTKSNEHAWAPGTVWLSAETLLAVLDDIGRSLATTAAKTLVFVNAHGGNSALLQVACRDLRLRHGLRTFLIHPFTKSEAGNELGMGIHGSHDETSVLLHLRPDLVDMSKAVRQVPEHLADNKHVKWGGAVSFGWLSNDFEPAPTAGSLPLGIIGDPTRADAEHGARQWEEVLTMMGEAFAEIAAWRTY